MLRKFTASVSQKRRFFCMVDIFSCSLPPCAFYHCIHPNNHLRVTHQMNSKISILNIKCMRECCNGEILVYGVTSVKDCMGLHVICMSKHGLLLSVVRRMQGERRLTGYHRILIRKKVFLQCCYVQ